MTAYLGPHKKCKRCRNIVIWEPRWHRRGEAPEGFATFGRCACPIDNWWSCQLKTGEIRREFPPKEP